MTKELNFFKAEEEILDSQAAIPAKKPKQVERGVDRNRPVWFF